jgi:hypothetical protein
MKKKLIYAKIVKVLQYKFEISPIYQFFPQKKN